MKKLFLLLILFLCSTTAFSQYSSTRSRGAKPFASAPSNPVNGDWYYDTGLSKFRCRQAGSWTDCIGSGGTPGGSNTQLQYNNAGAFGGISGATSDGTNVTFGSGNLRATSPRITTSLSDTNGATAIGIVATASGVTYPEFASGINDSNFGNATIQAKGVTNSYLKLKSSGTSYVWANGRLGVNNASGLDPLLHLASGSDNYPDSGTTAAQFWNGTNPTGWRLLGNRGYYGDGDGNQTIDVGLYPASAGLWEVNNGTAGTYRDIVLRTRYYSGTSVGDFSGSGSPEGVVTASVGSTYRRTDGGAGTSFYVKESGSGNTGWVAK